MAGGRQLTDPVEAGLVPPSAEPQGACPSLRGTCVKALTVHTFKLPVEATKPPGGAIMGGMPGIPGIMGGMPGMPGLCSDSRLRVTFIRRVADKTPKNKLCRFGLPVWGDICRKPDGVGRQTGPKRRPGPFGTRFFVRPH